jgi:hypothetical protein
MTHTVIIIAKPPSYSVRSRITRRLHNGVLSGCFVSFGSMVFVPLLLPCVGRVRAIIFPAPPLRRSLIARASSLVINPQYKRPQPREHQHFRWSVQEVLPHSLSGLPSLRRRVVCYRSLGSSTGTSLGQESPSSTKYGPWQHTAIRMMADN